jgi:hypothetical protein
MGNLVNVTFIVVQLFHAIRACFVTMIKMRFH